MTISYPTKVYTQKKNAWQYMPTVLAMATPKVTEWNAGIAVQCSIDASALQYDLAAATGKSQRYCDLYETETPGRKTISLGMIDVYADPSAPTAAPYALATAWKLEPAGYLALRSGYADDLAAATAQNVTVLCPIKVQSLGLVPPNPGDSTDVYHWRFNLLVTGDPKWDIALVP